MGERCWYSYIGLHRFLPISTPKGASSLHWRAQKSPRVMYTRTAANFAPFFEYNLFKWPVYHGLIDLASNSALQCCSEEGVGNGPLPTKLTVTLYIQFYYTVSNSCGSWDLQDHIRILHHIPIFTHWYLRERGICSLICTGLIQHRSNLATNQLSK